MKDFIDKTTENLEEKIKVTSLEIIVTGTKDKPYFEIKYKELGKEDYSIGYSSYDLNNVFAWKDECFEIVNELAEEYKDKVMIDGQYCWQTCSDTEHCKECNRLCNGSIDYYENYDFMAEEYKGGWIPCDKEMPKAGTQRDVWISIENEVISYKAKWYLDHFEWDNGWAIKENILAWMPNDVPAPYTKGE